MFPPQSRFLVVDDFPTMRKIIKKLLLQLGYLHIEEADDGTSGLLKIREAAEQAQPFSLIISDWQMPKMLGIDLLKACKADPRLAATLFMLVSTEREDRFPIEAAQAGASEHIVKPFDAITLRYKLERAYERHQNKQAA